MGAIWRPLWVAGAVMAAVACGDKATEKETTGAETAAATVAETEAETDTAAVTETGAAAETETAAGTETETAIAAETGAAAEREAKGSDTSAEDEGEAATKSSIPATEAAAAPVRFAIGSGSRASFLIDAPLEKIKGRWTRFGGSIQVNPGDLAATRGKVSMELGDLKTHTFGEPGKDSRQTSHALNWMQVGPEVSATARQRHGTATFVIEGIEGASPPKLADGQLTVQAKVTGTLTLHGVKAKKTVPVEVTFQGPADAPTAVAIRSASPMRISLKQHDIKPRDLAGRFLAGALDKIGQKIADTAQVTINLKGKAPRADPRLP